MARTKSTEVSTQSPDIKKIEEFYNQNKDRVANFATAQEALRKLTDLTKTKWQFNTSITL